MPSCTLESFGEFFKTWKAKVFILKYDIYSKVLSHLATEEAIFRPKMHAR